MFHCYFRLPERSYFFTHRPWKNISFGIGNDDFLKRWSWCRIKKIQRLFFSNALDFGHASKRGTCSDEKAWWRLVTVSEQLWMWAASGLYLKSVTVFIMSLCHGIFTKSLRIRNLCIHLDLWIMIWDVDFTVQGKSHHKVQPWRIAEPEVPVVNGSNSACSAYVDSNSTNHEEV